MSFNRGQSKNQNIGPIFGALGPAVEYLTDAAQRTIPSWDVRLQRSDAYREQAFQNAPRFLSYECELLVGGVGRRPLRFAGVQPLGIGIATISPSHEAAQPITGETLCVDGGYRVID